MTRRIVATRCFRRSRETTITCARSHLPLGGSRYAEVTVSTTQRRSFHGRRFNDGNLSDQAAQGSAVGVQARSQTQERGASRRGLAQLLVVAHFRAVGGQGLRRKTVGR